MNMFQGLKDNQNRLYTSWDISFTLINAGKDGPGKLNRSDRMMFK